MNIHLYREPLQTFLSYIHILLLHDMKSSIWKSKTKISYHQFFFFFFVRHEDILIEYIHMKDTFNSYIGV